MFTDEGSLDQPGTPCPRLTLRVRHGWLAHGIEWEGLALMPAGVSRRIPPHPALLTPERNGFFAPIPDSPGREEGMYGAFTNTK